MQLTGTHHSTIIASTHHRTFVLSYFCTFINSINSIAEEVAHELTSSPLAPLQHGEGYGVRMSVRGRLFRGEAEKKPTEKSVSEQTEIIFICIKQFTLMKDKNRNHSLLTTHLSSLQRIIAPSYFRLFINSINSIAEEVAHELTSSPPAPLQQGEGCGVRKSVRWRLFRSEAEKNPTEKSVSVQPEIIFICIKQFTLMRIKTETTHYSLLTTHHSSLIPSTHHRTFVLSSLH